MGHKGHGIHIWHDWCLPTLRVGKISCFLILKTLLFHLLSQTSSKKCYGVWKLKRKFWGWKMSRQSIKGCLLTSLSDFYAIDDAYERRSSACLMNCVYGPSIVWKPWSYLYWKSAIKLSESLPSYQPNSWTFRALDTTNLTRKKHLKWYVSLLQVWFLEHMLKIIQCQR